MTNRRILESTDRDGGRERLLRGGRPPYQSNFSSREMESLTAACDTFLPSIKLSDDSNESLTAFYGTSASMIGTPEHAAGMMSEKLRHPANKLLRVGLWFLSTWYGTFALCGRASLSSQFPYFQKFSKVTLHKREEILLSWSSSSFNHNKMLFKCLKLLTMFMFFTMVDEKNENPSWKALGYLGPDPDLVKHSPQHKNKITEKKKACLGPLHQAVVDMADQKAVAYSLQRAGIPNSTSSSTWTIHCDAVVVGSGSGGSVVAGVLAQAGYKVVVLEKGSYFATSNLSLLEGPTIEHMYEGSGFISTDNLSAYMLAGSTIGGGSTINWSASIRTPGHVLNEWQDKYELKIFGSKEYKHALDVVCNRMGVQSEVKNEGYNNAVLRKGCLKLGYPVDNVAVNAPSDHYCGWCHLGCKGEKKKSTQLTWLLDLVDSGNGVILQGCKAIRVLKDKEGERDVATGVLVEIHSKHQGDNEVLVVKSKVTVIACGALNTPPLLKRSGLRNPYIGRHLHLHPVVMAWGYFPENNGWPEVEKRSYEGAIITAMSPVVANFDTSGYGVLLQTPALHPGMFSALMPWISAADFRKRMTRFSRTAHLFALARDKGSGTTGDFPKSVRYQLDTADEENLKNGLEKMLRILAAAGAELIGTQHCEGEMLNVKSSSSEELEQFIEKVGRRKVRDFSTPISSAHQMGSCKMGIDPSVSAVNPRGETWEVKGLFVADSSVFPTALGVNPMVTVQAIAYCTAHSVLQVLRRN